jgi:hypothetical protein
VVNDGHAVTDRLCLLQVVRADQHRDPVVTMQVSDQRPQLVAHQWVEPDGRLVEHQDAWPGEESTGNLQAAPHAAAVAGHRVTGTLGQAHDIKQLGDPGSPFALGHPPQPSVQPQVRPSRQVHVERAGLEHHPHQPAHLQGVRAHLTAGDNHPSRRGRDGSAEHPERRALARPVGPEQTKHLTVAHLERDPPHRLGPVGVHLGDVLDLDGCQPGPGAASASGTGGRLLEGHASRSTIFLDQMLHNL